MNPDTCPGGCWHTIGRLSVALAKEIQKTTVMEAVIFTQQQRIDELEQAPAMVAEVERYLRDGGS